MTNNCYNGGGDSIVMSKTARRSPKRVGELEGGESSEWGELEGEEKEGEGIDSVDN